MSKSGAVVKVRRKWRKEGGATTLNKRGVPEAGEVRKEEGRG
jgi:hypothetical protein